MVLTLVSTVSGGFHRSAVQVFRGRPEHSVRGPEGKRIFRTAGQTPRIRPVRVPCAVFAGAADRNFLPVVHLVRVPLQFRVHRNPHDSRFLRCAGVEFVLRVHHAARHPVHHVRTDVEAQIQVGQRHFHKQCVYILIPSGFSSPI